MDDMKACRYCGELVKKEARKCKHCHEWVIRRSIFVSQPFKIGVAVLLAILVYHLSSMLIIVGTLKKSVVSPMLKSFDEDSGLEVTNHKCVEEGGHICILGQVKNVGQTKWSSIQVKAEFFDQSGNFVESGTEILFGPLKPGKTENFKMKILGLKRSSFSDYKVSVIDASTSMF